MKPGPPAVEARSLYHWTARKVPESQLLRSMLPCHPTHQVSASPTLRYIGISWQSRSNADSDLVGALVSVLQRNGNNRKKIYKIYMLKNIYRNKIRYWLM